MRTACDQPVRLEKFGFGYSLTLLESVSVWLILHYWLPV